MYALSQYGGVPCVCRGALVVWQQFGLSVFCLAFMCAFLEMVIALLLLLLLPHSFPFTALLAVF